MSAEIIPITPITPYTIQFATEEPQPLPRISPATVRQARIVAEFLLGELLPIEPGATFPDFRIFDVNDEVVFHGLGRLL